MGRILVVDDSKEIRDILSDVLSSMGFQVSVASNGNEGLNLLFVNPFELVLTDLQMPGMDGWTLDFHIKDRSPDTPVVLITGSEREVVLERLGESRVDSAIFKPFSLEEIQETVQAVLKREALET